MMRGRRVLRFVALLIAVGVLASCGAATNRSITSATVKQYYLPVLKSGEVARVTRSPWWMLSKWMRRISKHQILVLESPVSSDGELSDQATEHLTADVKFTVDDRTVNVARMAPGSEGVSIEITLGQLSVFAVGSVYGEVALLDVAKAFRDVPVPWLADSKELPGFEPFREPISQGMIYPTKEVIGFHFQLPAPGGLTMDDVYGPLVELKLADRTVLTTRPDASGKEGFGWVEPDGLEVTLFGKATGPQAIRDFDRAFRRVERLEWDAAVQTANAPPTTTEPPNVAKWPRDASLPIPTSLQFVEPFMPGTLGELGQSHNDVVIDSAPTEAIQAAMWRIEARLEVMRYDGVETEEGDPDFAFESINGVPGHSGFGLEIVVLDDNGRSALMKVIREELAYVGVKRATISSAVTKGFE